MKLVCETCLLFVFGCVAWADHVGQDQAAPPAATSTWRQVMYLGGHPDVRAPSRTWNNSLSVSSERIVLRLRNGKSIEVEPGRVTRLAFEGRHYGKDTNVADFAVAGALLGAVGIALSWHQRTTKEHFIALEYVLPDNRPAGLLLRAHKSNYRAIGEALLAATRVEPVRE